MPGLKVLFCLQRKLRESTERDASGDMKEAAWHKLLKHPRKGLYHPILGCTLLT